MTPELAHSLDSIFPQFANSRRGAGQLLSKTVPPWILEELHRIPCLSAYCNQTAIIVCIFHNMLRAHPLDNYLARNDQKYNYSW